MITQKKILQLREQMLLNEQFFASYNTAIDWAKNHTGSQKDRFSIADHYRMLMIKNKWGRQAGYAFWSLLNEDYKLSGLMNEALLLEMKTLEKRILGQCEAAQIIRFHNDPPDSEELSRYVHSEAWLDEAYYSQ